MEVLGNKLEGNDKQNKESAKKQDEAEHVSAPQVPVSEEAQSSRMIKRETKKNCGQAIKQCKNHACFSVSENKTNKQISTLKRTSINKNAWRQDLKYMNASFLSTMFYSHFINFKFIWCDP